MSTDRAFVGLVLIGAFAGQSYSSTAPYIRLINRDSLPDIRTSLDANSAIVDYTEFRYFSMKVCGKYFGFWIPSYWPVQLPEKEIELRILHTLCEGFHRPITYYTDY